MKNICQNTLNTYLQYHQQQLGQIVKEVHRTVTLTNHPNTVNILKKQNILQEMEAEMGSVWEEGVSAP